MESAEIELTNRNDLLNSVFYSNSHLNPETFNDANPFPHFVIDNFLSDSLANKINKTFPKVKSSEWINYIHYNENKFGLNKIEALPQSISDLITYLNSSDFLKYLSVITGIQNLVSDPNLEGAGLHQSLKGGFLNIHSDFSSHPHHSNWKRQLNLLIYFNEDWKEGYGGQLEFWQKDMQKCIKSIMPINNRCVIFKTDEHSFHGFPDKLNCPENESRKSLALYYYTEEEDLSFHSTNYKARPQDGIKSLFIYLDKKILSFYSRIKRVFGLNDNFASTILGLFRKK